MEKIGKENKMRNVREKFPGVYEKENENENKKFNETKRNRT